MPSYGHFFSLSIGPALIALVWFLIRWYLDSNRELIEMIRKPENDDSYWEERAKIHAVYVKQLDHYSKLMLWASGGAFVVSFTAVQFLSRSTDGTFQSFPGSIRYLLLGWGLLVLAVIIEIGSPYASSRMARDAKAALTAIHQNDETRSRAEKMKSEGWGKIVKLLNELGYCLLLLAFWYLGVYVYWNLP